MPASHHDSLPGVTLEPIELLLLHDSDGKDIYRTSHTGVTIPYILLHHKGTGRTAVYRRTIPPNTFGDRSSAVLSVFGEFNLLYAGPEPCYRIVVRQELDNGVIIFRQVYPPT